MNMAFRCTVGTVRTLLSVVTFLTAKVLPDCTMVLDYYLIHFPFSYRPGSISGVGNLLTMIAAATILR